MDICWSCRRIWRHALPFSRKVSQLTARVFDRRMTFKKSYQLGIICGGGGSGRCFPSIAFDLHLKNHEYSHLSLERAISELLEVPFHSRCVPCHFDEAHKPEPGPARLDSGINQLFRRMQNPVEKIEWLDRITALLRWPWCGSPSSC